MVSKEVVVETEFEIVEKSVLELQKALEVGEVTSEQLVDLYLQRIEAIDQSGPTLNSIITVNEKALEEARLLDAERKEKGARGPLHGIPVILKDNYDTFDMPTTAGSVTLKDSIPSQDATLTKLLREAGAIFIAKSNLHEYAYGISTISSLGGQTFNPYKINHHPGGSSGGTGAAIAASLAAVGMGTDTGCSIRNPSSYNNLVGLRPSYGLTSRAGIVPISFTQDTGGPMGRQVEDVAVVMDVIAGKFDERDPITEEGVGKKPSSYVASLGAKTFDGVKIGVLNAYFGDCQLTMPTTTVVKNALEIMKEKGAELIDIEIDVLDEIDNLNLSAMEFRKAIEDYLATLPSSPLKKLEQLIDGKEISAVVERRLVQALDYSVDSEEYKDALEKRATYLAVVQETFKKYEIDVIAYPTFKSPPPIIGKEYWEFNNGALSAATGVPAISFPAGFTDEGLPVGIEFAADIFEEEKLLQLAYAFEKLTNYRTPPTLG
ncbi:MAG: amidase family protein [Solibacillus sp.]